MLEKNKRSFASELDKYSKDSYWRNDEEYLVEKYFRNKKGRLLVLGCGGGRTLLPLHKKGYKITAIDVVPEMVEVAKKRVNGLDIDVKHMDAVKLYYIDNYFDYVFFPFHGIDNIIPDVEDCIKEVARVLKSDGIFIYNSHNRWFWKKFKNIFSKYAYYDSYKQYRSTVFDVYKLKKYFQKADFKFRIMMQNRAESNWKDKCYQVFPFISSSIYFIAKKPKNK